MNLNTITTVKRPVDAGEIRSWHASYAWLAGGTWLFSEPQPATDTLIDLERLRWPSLQVTGDGLDIAATCRIVELYRLQGPTEWTALPLLRECCNALLASFKIWTAATVGGNICLSLPAGAMTSLVVALEGRLTLGLVAALRGVFQRSISSRATTRMSSHPVNCSAASIFRPRRSRSGMPSDVPRSSSWGDRPRFSLERGASTTNFSSPLRRRRLAPCSSPFPGSLRPTSFGGRLTPLFPRIDISMT
ncbi:MAG: FAD binding domain-containing protein [Bryobacteraceae bacterium]